MRRNFATFGKSLQVYVHFNGLLIIWQNAEHTWANLRHYWANFHSWKWPNIGKESNHLVALIVLYTIISITQTRN